MYAKMIFMTAVLLSVQVFAQTTSPSTVKAKSTKTSTKKKTKNKSSVEPQLVEVKKEVAAAPVAPITNSTSAPKKVGNYIKEHFSVAYHGEYLAVRRDVDSSNVKEHDIQDLKIMHNPSLTYKPSLNWQISSSAEFKYSDNDASIGSFPNSFYRALFSATKKSLLTEKENGLQLDAGVARRVFNSGIGAASYGNNRIFTSMSKTYDKKSSSLFLQYLHNDYRVSSSTTWKHGFEIIPTFSMPITEKLSYMFNDDIVINTPKAKNSARDLSITHEMNLAYLNYQWTEKLSYYYQFKYNHIEDFTDTSTSKDDSFDNYFGVSYAYNPKAIITFEAGNELFHARDGKDFFSKKVKYPEFSIFLDLSL